MRTVPAYTPVFGADDAAATARAVAEGQVSASAPPVRAFEQAAAERCGMPHAIAVANGTAALELAVSALGLVPGDEVLCPSMTIISCARAIVLSGAKPVLVDVDPRTYCLDVGQVGARVGPATRAILGVHAFGHPYDHPALSALARERGLVVIEDAAQAHGATVRVDGAPRPCGGLGDVSTFSFYANKAVTTGEGGMVLARDPRVAQRIRDLSNLFLGGERRFLHRELGHNYRLSSVQAALGVSQLAKLDGTVATKRRIAADYRARLARLEEIELQGTEPYAEPVPWMNTVVLSDAVAFDAAELARALARRGIETRPFFVGLHEQPALLDRGLFHGERFPVTERLSRRGLYLPSGLDLDEGTIDHVVRELTAALAELRTASRAVVPRAEAPSVLPEPSATVFGPLFAEAYDVLYAEKDYAAEVRLLAECFERFSGAPVRRVLDVGCGTGRHALELRKLGYDVVGVDRSPAMLAIAKDRVPEVRFREGDMSDLDVGETVDAVAILFAALSYQTSAESLLRTLRAVRRHLAPGGVLVADVWFGASTFPPGVPSRRQARSGGFEWTRIGHFDRNPATQEVAITYELRRKSLGGDGAETVSREIHRMHYFLRFELELALEAAGFRLASLSREGDLGAPPRPSDTTALFVAVAK